MNYNEKLRLKRYVEESRRVGGAAHVVAESKLDGLISALAHQLSETFTFDQMEVAIRAEVHAYPSVRIPSVGSQEEADILAAARAKAGPSKAQIAAMSAGDRLAHENRKKLAEIEKAKEAAGQVKGEHSFNDLKAMSASARLALAREWSALGADETESAQPLTRAELERMSADRRLSHANELALRGSKKDTKP